MPTRRTFLQGLAAGLATALARPLHAREKPPQPTPPKGPRGGAPKAGEIAIPRGPMPTRALGRTGVKVSLLGLGGWHLGVPKEDGEAIRIVHAAMDHGVTFLDNCWDYNDGLSEKRMGEALQGGRRQRAVLMTKLDGRTRAAATAQLEQSLRRLHTDVIDLVQVHEVIRFDDANKVFEPDGAMGALVDARKAGKLRFIGFTGHKDPAIHLHMLEVAKEHQLRFDAVQMPLNVMDPHFQSFAGRVLPALKAEEIGVLGMKPLGSGLILESGLVTAPECLRYAMSLPTSVVITGCDTFGVLEQALAAALSFKPMSTEEMDALLGRTAADGAKGEYEEFKTTVRFDGTTQHPWWLDSARL